MGQAELDLIQTGGFREFPPRLPEQPIFYPVITKEYAIEIARNWNTRDSRSGFVGYVLSFQVRADFLNQYEKHTVGDARHVEYWIPAADLMQFNKNIVGRIQVILEFREGAS